METVIRQYENRLYLIRNIIRQNKLCVGLHRLRLWDADIHIKWRRYIVGWWIGNWDSR